MTGLHFSGFATRAAASGWGVLRLPIGPSTWLVAGTGLPNVEVAGLTIVPSNSRQYSAVRIRGRPRFLILFIRSNTRTSLRHFRRRMIRRILSRKAQVYDRDGPEPHENCMPQRMAEMPGN